MNKKNRDDSSTTKPAINRDTLPAQSHDTRQPPMASDLVDTKPERGDFESSTAKRNDFESSARLPASRPPPMPDAKEKSPKIPGQSPIRSAALADHLAKMSERRRVPRAAKVDTDKDPFKPTETKK